MLQHQDFIMFRYDDQVGHVRRLNPFTAYMRKRVYKPVTGLTPFNLQIDSDVLPGYRRNFRLAKG